MARTLEKLSGTLVVADEHDARIASVTLRTSANRHAWPIMRPTYASSSPQPVIAPPVELEFGGSSRLLHKGLFRGCRGGPRRTGSTPRPYGSQSDGGGALQGHEANAPALRTCGKGRASGTSGDAETAGKHGELADNRLGGVAGVWSVLACTATGDNLVVVVG